MTAWLIDLIGAVVPGIIVGIVLAIWNKHTKEHTDAENEKRQRQAEVWLCGIDLDLANAQLTQEIAMAIKRGTTNGEMNAALQEQQKALDRFRKVERMQMVLHGMEGE